MKFHYITKRFDLLILSILPLLYILFAKILKSEIGYYHLFSTEPGYSYMFNGLNITRFSLPWMIEHPGIPLSVLSAIVIQITHFFRPLDTLIVDLFKDPEFYLNTIVAVLVAVDGIILFLMGFFIYKSSKNILTSIFFQMTPFVSWTVLSFSKLVMVEHLVIIFM